MQGPLELYANAFKLQSRGDKEEAVRIYRDLIARFPESKEREYAQVQLETLLGSENASPTGLNMPAASQPAAPGKTGVLGIIAFILSLVVLLGLLVLVPVILQQRTQLKFQQAYTQAVAAALSNDFPALQRYFRIAKGISPRRKAPYLLVADYHIRKKEYPAAMQVLRTCPTFDAEIRRYYDRIKKINEAGGVK